MSQPVSWEARRTFWPRRPMASESCSSGTTTSILSESSSSTTLATSAGCKALTTKVATSGDQGMMSIFSPCKLAHHGLDARAAHADAGADRVDRGIARDHRDLGARARIAGHRLHLDDAVIDLRHFLAEELGHEQRMGARQENLRPALLAPHVKHIGADAVAGLEGLARDRARRGARWLRRGPRSTMTLPYSTRLTVPLTIWPMRSLNSSILPVALGLAHLLHDHLLRRLRGDPAELEGRERLGDVIAGLSRRVALARIFDADLRRGIVDRVGDQKMPRDPQFAGLRIDLGMDIGLEPVARTRRLGDQFLHRRDHDLPVDELLARHRVGDLQKLQPVCTDGHVSLTPAIDVASYFGNSPGDPENCARSSRTGQARRRHSDPLEYPGSHRRGPSACRGATTPSPNRR